MSEQWMSTLFFECTKCTTAVNERGPQASMGLPPVSHYSKCLHWSLPPTQAKWFNWWGLLVSFPTKLLGHTFLQSPGAPSHLYANMHLSHALLTINNVPFNNICDSGTSCCAFNSLQYFPHGIEDPPQELHLGGISNSLLIHGVGIAMITLHTHHLTTLHIQIPYSLYVPDLPCNLISLQWLISTLQTQNKKSSFHIFPNGCLLLINDHVILLQYFSQPFWAMLSSVSTPMTHQQNPDLLCGFDARITLIPPFQPFWQTLEQYANLTANQCQLYDWHVCLGHMNFASIQNMACKNIGIPRALTSCQPPLVKHVSMANI